jgi:NADPH:quinone reductase-like Zn-dependent oxidoreductase
VEAVGSGVTRVRPGDEVYANLLSTDTAALPNVSVPVEVLSLKPANLSFEEAAAVPMAGSPPCSRVWAGPAAAPASARALVVG